MSEVIEHARYTCAISALHTVLAIPRGIPILHSGPGCASRQYGKTPYSAGYQGEGYAGGGKISCTNTSQTEVVFGGEEKLRTTIAGTLKVVDGDLYVVQSGCTAGIIGDDVEAVAGEFADKGYPVIGVDTAGFRGNNYVGHELVVNTIINQFVGNIQPHIRKKTVNVFSVVPYQDIYWRGDLEEIKRILEGIGLKVNILYGYGSAGVSEWKDIPNAQFNLVIGPWVGLSTAQLLEKKYGTPYLHYPILPVGLKATSKFLRKVAEFAGLDSKAVEGFIEKEERRVKQYFVSFGDFVSDFSIMLPYNLYTIADSAYGLGLTDFLVNELGLDPKGVYVTENPDASNQTAIKKFAGEIDERLSDRIIFEPDGAVINKNIEKDLEKERVKSVILGSSVEENLRHKRNIVVKVSLPVTDRIIMSNTYVGYQGGLNLMEDLYSDLFHDGKIHRNASNGFKKAD